MYRATVYRMLSGLMTMTASAPGTGIFHLIVMTAEGRAVEYDDNGDEINF